MSDEKEYLVRGAKLKCNFGSHPRRMNLPKGHGSYILELSKPMVNRNDCIPQLGPKGPENNVNIMSFGACSSPKNDKPSIVFEGTDGKSCKGKECHPTFSDKWQAYHESMFVNEAEALTTDSYLVCLCGGIIKVETSGQEAIEEETIKAASD